MKKTSMLFLAAALATPLIASAAPADGVRTVKPFKMTCEEFLSVSDTYKPAVVYWIASVDKLGVRENDQITVDTPRTVEHVVEECKKAPKQKLAAHVKKSQQDETLKINFNGA
ncbi:HdeA/HdeB family chaperone [Cupriavidus agavae]|uniref:Acid stress chaperone HdeA n=1 Tax=Cupriavidus agavae TaxID=1001822 RepID=A0A4Q7RZT4_9BURK|nr:HdeA/HdeB family chaperone [Cupriavidus agavae]RZT39384.1 acid stress chaperone HdeA [Cupriavidus agavae]